MNIQPTILRVQAAMALDIFKDAPKHFFNKWLNDNKTAEKMKLIGLSSGAFGMVGLLGAAIFVGEPLALPAFIATPVVGAVGLTMAAFSVLKNKISYSEYENSKILLGQNTSLFNSGKYQSVLENAQKVEKKLKV